MKKIGLMSLVLGLALALGLSAAPPKPANLTIKNVAKMDITEIYFYDQEKDEYSPNLLKKPLAPSKSIVVMIPPGGTVVYLTAVNKDGVQYVGEKDFNLKPSAKGNWDVKVDELYIPEDDPYGYEEGDY